MIWFLDEDKERVMKLELFLEDFSICKVKELPSSDVGGRFFFVMKTDREITVVCETRSVPDDPIDVEDGWKAFRIKGILDFSLVGIISKLSKILADHQIGIFVVSTFETDYVLVKQENFSLSLHLLSQYGYQIVEYSE